MIPRAKVLSLKNPATDEQTLVIFGNQETGTIQICFPQGGATIQHNLNAVFLAFGYLL